MKSQAHVSVAIAGLVLLACLNIAESQLFAIPPPRKEVFKFYVHDNIFQKTGNTAVLVAGPDGNTSELQQGSLVIVNDLITEGPSESSRVLGHAQGQYSNSAFLPNPHIHQLFTAVFTDKYNGTIAYHGDDNVLLPVREIAVVGGTGQFRMAEGYALIETYNQTDLWSFTFSVETHLFLPPLEYLDDL